MCSMRCLKDNMAVAAGVNTKPSNQAAYAKHNSIVLNTNLLFHHTQHKSAHPNSSVHQTPQTTMGRFPAGNNADPGRLQRIMDAKQRLIGVRVMRCLHCQEVSVHRRETPPCTKHCSNAQTLACRSFMPDYNNLNVLAKVTQPAMTHAAAGPPLHLSAAVFRWTCRPWMHRLRQRGAPKSKNRRQKSM